MINKTIAADIGLIIGFILHYFVMGKHLDYFTIFFFQNFGIWCGYKMHCETLSGINQNKR